MDKRCIEITQTGERCKFLAKPPYNYCGFHLGEHQVRRTKKKAVKKAKKKR